MAAVPDMYVNNTDSSQTGGLAIAVPGEMACYALAHDQYGQAEWKYLINLIIDLIQQNVIITKTQVEPVQKWGDKIKNNEMFKNNDGRIKRVGDQIVNQKLADTFKIIAEDKWAFHEGNPVSIKSDNDSVSTDQMNFKLKSKLI